MRRGERAVRVTLGWLLLGAWLVWSGAGQAVELRLEGQLVQGALVRGQVVPGSTVRLGERRLRVSGAGRFVFGIGRDQAGPLTLAVRTPDGATAARELAIERRRWDVQRIDGLPPRQVAPSPADLERIRAEQALIDRARAQDSAEPGFDLAPIWPALGPVSGVFGSQRILNGQPRAPHRGVDVAAPRGSPVKAMAPGVVTLAEADLYFTGGTVMIDHGHGLSSLYAHLDEVRVTPGQRLGQGEVLGTIGATGRVTGPHLHWGVYWFAEAIDPALLVPPMPSSDG
jgi:murein DD-endopeptidase MepM/ murein hydrolase activator NlpD